MVFSIKTKMIKSRGVNVYTTGLELGVRGFY